MIVMIYLKWLLMVPVMLLISAITFPLAFVLPFFAVERQGVVDNGTGWGWGYYLPKWLGVFQAPDNSLGGDYGWKTEHWQWRFKLPAALCTYVGMVGWLWRNPGYGFGLEVVDGMHAGYAGNPKVNDSPGVEGYCLVHAGGLFQFVWVKRLTTNKCVYINFGWNIKGLINDPRDKYTATFAFSPRIATWKD